MASVDITPRRLLLVEDNHDARTILQMGLELYGYQVEPAADGFEAVRKALDWRPDVAVVDIGLPGLNGFQVAEELRAAYGDDLLLIALTAYSDPERRRQAFESGFDVFLTKPADLA